MILKGGFDNFELFILSSWISLNHSILLESHFLYVYWFSLYMKYQMWSDLRELVVQHVGAVA